MKKFLILSHFTKEAQEEMSSRSSEEKKQTMSQWMAWQQKHKTQIIDMGAPFVNSKQIALDGSTSPSIKNISGYMMIKAESLEEAIELLKDSPLLPYQEGCEIEIHEAMNMNM